ncbi:hypothetical protein SAMN05216390_1059 [Lachnospiraceae bacterium KH1T2]|nr:hypothetical protein SAMN05216390_1059 [Lachnospiraceae bacterium KH1T2]
MNLKKLRKAQWLTASICCCLLMFFVFLLTTVVSASDLESSGLNDSLYEIPSGTTITYTVNTKGAPVAEIATSKDTRTIDNFESILEGGVLLNGGTLYIKNYNKEHTVYIGSLVVNATSKFYNEGNVAVRGNYEHTKGTLSLEGSDLDVRGSLKLSNGQIDLDSGALHVYKDLILRMESKDKNGNVVYERGQGFLTMKEEHGYLEVDGEMYLDNAKSCIFDAGTIVVKGDLTAVELGAWMKSKNDAEINWIFNGSEPQHIYVSRSRPIANNNTFDTVQTINPKITIEGGNHHSNECGIAIKRLIDDIQIKGNADDLTILDWNGCNITVGGRFICATGGSLDGGAKLTVGGDLYLTNGEINIGNGSVEVGGDFKIRSAKRETDGSYSFGTGKGCIRMEDESGYLKVGGDMYIYTSNSSTLNAGTIELKGNLETIILGGWKTTSLDSMKWIFSGSEEQILDIKKTDPASGVQVFGVIELVNTKVKVSSGGELAIGRLVDDLHFEDKVSNLTVVSWNGYGVKIDGDYVSTKNTKLGKQSTMVIGGNMYLEAGTIDVENGSIHVRGNLNVRKLDSVSEDGTPIYKRGTGIINMKNPEGSLEVDGGIYWDSSKASALNSGYIKTSGNIETYNADAWNTTGSDMLWLLDGNKEQNISIKAWKFDKGSSIFGTLVSVGKGIKTDTGFAVGKLTNDITINGDVTSFGLKDFNEHKIYVKNTSIEPEPLISVSYNASVSRNKENPDNYDVEYSEDTSYHTVTFNVAPMNSDSFQVRHRQTHVKRGSLLFDFSVPLDDNEAFDGWYKDKELSEHFDIKTETVSSDFALYGKIYYCEKTLIDINTCKFEVPSSFVYNGRVPSCEPVVSLSGNVLFKNVDYTVRTLNAPTEAGEYLKLEVKGINDFTGIKNINIEIEPAEPRLNIKVEEKILYEDGDFPAIMISKGDTPGDIRFEDGQRLIAGTHSYIWRYEPISSNYKIKAGRYPLTATAVEIKGIEIVQSQNKKVYVEGDKFDPTGLKVKAVYNDGSEKKFDDCYAAYPNKRLRITDTKATAYIVDRGEKYLFGVPVRVIEGDPSEPYDPDDPDEPTDPEDEKFKYPIAYTIKGNGRIGINDEIFRENGTKYVLKGTSVSFNFIPDEGYMVKVVTIDGEPIGKYRRYTFTNVTSNHYVNVEFEAKTGDPSDDIYDDPENPENPENPDSPVNPGSDDNGNGKNGEDDPNGAEEPGNSEGPDTPVVPGDENSSVSGDDAQNSSNKSTKALSENMVTSDMLSIDLDGYKLVYTKNITFWTKKAVFVENGIKLYNREGAEVPLKKVKIRKATKVGETTFKIVPILSDKSAKKKIRKAKFPVTIVPYEVSSSDVVLITRKSNAKIKKVTINGIKLKKKEYSEESNGSLVYSGRFVNYKLK